MIWGDLKGGETVAIFGAGPVGSMSVKSAILHNAKKVIVVDTLQYRLDQIKKLTGCTPDGVTFPILPSLAEETKKTSEILS